MKHIKKTVIIGKKKGPWAIDVRVLRTWCEACQGDVRKRDVAELELVAVQARNGIRFNLQEPWNPRIFIHKSHADESYCG
jgi:hypothetical protein